MNTSICRVKQVVFNGKRNVAVRHPCWRPRWGPSWWRTPPAASPARQISDCPYSQRSAHQTGSHNCCDWINSNRWARDLSPNMAGLGIRSFAHLLCTLSLKISHFKERIALVALERCEGKIHSFCMLFTILCPRANLSRRSLLICSFF